MGSFKGIPKNILESERDRLLKTFDLDRIVKLVNERICQVT